MVERDHPSAPEDWPRTDAASRPRGRIRVQPADFAVVEALAFTPAGHGEHLFLRIRKQDANTSWVAGQIARWAGVRKRDVGFAGRKDRHASTEQWFSCWLPGRADPPVSALQLPGVQVLETRRHVSKLRRGALVGNGFEVTVRDVSGGDDWQAVVAGLVPVVQRGFPNYFGDQRFGHDNLRGFDGVVRGSRAVSRDQREMSISAVRSYLFNALLAHHVRRATPLESDSGDVGSASPLPGLDMLGFGLSAEETCILARFPAWMDGLQQLGVRAHRRLRFIRPADFRVTMGDDWATFRFRLPRGVYATSLLREFFQPLEDVGHA
jgi:tRNA pseudouridine13 synthase